MKFFFSILLLIFCSEAMAHVKWFSDYSFEQIPLTMSNLTSNPIFWGLFVLSLITLPLLVWLDKVVEKSAMNIKLNTFFDRYAEHSTLILRVTMGAVLLMSWQGDSYIAPEIIIPTAFWGWFQFILALLLLFKETAPLTGLGMIVLYVMGIKYHGIFHMLDYIVYPSVGLYLILSSLKNEKFKNLDLPVLYSGLGFSLCWVAFEKMFYPYWGLEVLGLAPELTMGLPHDFFLLSAAFVEFTLGYLLIICLLHRPLAAVVTLVFFITTSFFGKTEVVGHTILHGALLVFIVRGPGSHYLAPIRFHKSLTLRNLFAVINFVVLFVVLAFPYEKMAKGVFERTSAEFKARAHPTLEIPLDAPRPSVTIHPTKDDNGGWNIHLMTSNFKFLPASTGREDNLGEGHAHLYLNGKKIGRVYSEWFHVVLPRGKNKLKISLNTNSHKDLSFGGEAIMSQVEIIEERESKTEHAH